jgi:hypothetical protein
MIKLYESVVTGGIFPVISMGVVAGLFLLVLLGGVRASVPQPRLQRIVRPRPVRRRRLPQ